MRRALWVLAWIGVALWSLFAWGAYGLLDVFGGIAARNADVVTSQPEAVEWLSWALSTLKGLGLAAIVVVWGLVSLLILAVPAVAGLFLRRSQPEPSVYDRQLGRRGGYPSGEPTRRIDRR
jgi:hypothetical protein